MFRLVLVPLELYIFGKARILARNSAPSYLRVGCALFSRPECRPNNFDIVPIHLSEGMKSKFIPHVLRETGIFGSINIPMGNVLSSPMRHVRHVQHTRTRYD